MLDSACPEGKEPTLTGTNSITIRSLAGQGNIRGFIHLYRRPVRTVRVARAGDVVRDWQRRRLGALPCGGLCTHGLPQVPGFPAEAK